MSSPDPHTSHEEGALEFRPVLTRDVIPSLRPLGPSALLPESWPASSLQRKQASHVNFQVPTYG